MRIIIELGEVLLVDTLHLSVDDEVEVSLTLDMGRLEDTEDRAILLDEVLGFVVLDGIHVCIGWGRLEGNFVRALGLFSTSTMGFVPETHGLKLGRLVLGGNLASIAKRTGLPNGGPVRQVGTLLGAVIRLQRESGQRGSLSVTKRSHEGGLSLARGGEFGVGVRDVLGRGLRSRLSHGRSGRTSRAVGLSIVILGSHASHGSQSVTAEVGDDSTSLLTSHALLGWDESIGGDGATVRMHDNRAYADSTFVADGELDDGEAMLGEDRLQSLKVSGERSVLRLMKRIGAVGMDVLGFLDGVDQTDVQFDLGFIGVGGHVGIVVHMGEELENVHVLRLVNG